jgi:hypothetical protein
VGEPAGDRGMRFRTTKDTKSTKGIGIENGIGLRSWNFEHLWSALSGRVRQVARSSVGNGLDEEVQEELKRLRDLPPDLMGFLLLPLMSSLWIALSGPARQAARSPTGLGTRRI